MQPLHENNNSSGPWRTWVGQVLVEVLGRGVLHRDGVLRDAAQAHMCAHGLVRRRCAAAIDGLLLDAKGVHDAIIKHGALGRIPRLGVPLDAG